METPGGGEKSKQCKNPSWTTPPVSFSENGVPSLQTHLCLNLQRQIVESFCQQTRRNKENPDSLTFPDALGKWMNESLLSRLRPHRLPTRPLCPWNSPGKSAGVGSHALLQGSNSSLPHCRWILYRLSQALGKYPRVLWQALTTFKQVANLVQRGLTVSHLVS